MLKTVGNPSTRYGDQTVIDGNLIIGTSGKGIDFSATPGTGTSELLDDYEEGTWTPLFTFATPGDLAVNPSAQSGRYTKVGNLVVCQFVIVCAPTWTTSSGYALLSGLPFTVQSVIDTGLGTLAGRGFTQAGRTSFNLLPISGNVLAYLVGTGSGVAEELMTNSNFVSGQTVVLQGTISFTS